MGTPRTTSSWLAALIAWLIAVATMAAGYAVWMYMQGQPIRWELVRNVAVVTLPLAIIRAWRDRNRRA